MVRALIGRDKTVTRRLSKRWLRVKAGDRLWVRETWALVFTDGPGWHRVYRADGELNRLTLCDGKWRPGIFMPRWASRIALEATEDAREEDLWSLGSEEALREGVEVFKRGNLYYLPGNGGMGVSEPRTAFSLLWDSLRTKPGERWEENPVVVRLAFQVTEVRNG